MSDESGPEDFVEAVICREGEIPQDGCKSFEIEGGKILLVHHKEELYAIGPKCSHFGAPLEKGSVSNGRIRCPFHGACFNLETGDIEDFPGLDSIPSYDVEVQGGDVVVRAERSKLATNKRVKKMARRDKKKNETFVVIGGGGAGATCIETLRQEGFKGRLVIVCKEQALPYDRTKLSKMMHSSTGELALRSMEFYERGDIEFLLGREAVALNTEDKTVFLSDKTELKYDKVFIATGGSPRALSIPGWSLPGVFVLRTPADANAIVEASKGANVVVVGSSFIGMEVAAYLMGKEDRASLVTVVGSSEIPFEKSLGAKVGGRLARMLEEKGVQFLGNDAVVEIQGEIGRVEKVVLRSGTSLPADVVVVGIGVTPATGFLKTSGVPLNEGGYVPVDEYLETSVKDVYCGGDIVSFPLFMTGGAPTNIGHWGMALKHGHTAALNMLRGSSEPLMSVPFFWTMLAGKSVRYAGHGKFDDILITGNVDDLSFIAHYCHGNRVVSVASCGKDPAAAIYANYLAMGRFLTKEEVVDDPEAVMKIKC